MKNKVKSFRKKSLVMYIWFLLQGHGQKKKRWKKAFCVSQAPALLKGEEGLWGTCAGSLHSSEAWLHALRFDSGNLHAAYNTETFLYQDVEHIQSLAWHSHTQSVFWPTSYLTIFPVFLQFNHSQHVTWVQEIKCLLTHWMSEKQLGQEISCNFDMRYHLQCICTVPCFGSLRDPAVDLLTSVQYLFWASQNFSWSPGAFSFMHRICF